MAKRSLIVVDEAHHMPRESLHKMKLRPYQEEAMRKIKEAMASGDLAGDTVLSIGRGAGKTPEPIAITAKSLARMPKPMAKRLKLGLRAEMVPEFEEWIVDMGYSSLVASPMMRQFLFEAFIGGWGAKVRQLKRKG